MKEIILTQSGFSKYVIVYPENASPSNITAVTELQKYVKLISGVELPIRTDAEEATQHEIAVGYTNRSENICALEERLGKDGFIIKTVGERIFILGGVRGALYGVYTFLEEYLGCRFYTSEYEKIPSNKTISVPHIECNEQIPDFEYRAMNFITSYKNNFQVKLKINGDIGDDKWGGRVVYTGFVHTFDNLVKPSIYGESHPEYWGVDADGTPHRHWGRQLCLTNPDVLRIAKDSVRELLASNPKTDIISISQNDTGEVGDPCMCAKCRAVYEEEGGAYSGAIIRFVNEIANEFADEYPNVKFDTLAYRYSRTVCKTKPASNVIVRICTIECCFSHPLGTCQDVYKKPGSDSSISADIAAWGEVTDNLYIWDYVTNFAHPTVMFPNFNTLLPNAKFFADNNVKGVFEEGNYFSDTGDFSDLRSYIMSKILWNPHMSEEQYWEYIDEFLRDVYGEGWKYIREYIDLAQRVVKDTHFGIYYSPDKLFFKIIENDQFELPQELTLEKIRNFEATDWTPYLEYCNTVRESELITYGDELFSAALSLATEEQRERIEKIKLQLDFLKSYLMIYKYWYKRVSVSQILKSFFAETDEGRSVSEAEQTDLLEKIDTHVKNCVCGEERATYERYNRELCRRGLKHRVVQFQEGRKKITSEEDVVKFVSEPRRWI